MRVRQAYKVESASEMPCPPRAVATPDPHTSRVAHAMLFWRTMKPLMILLILALGPALGQLTAPEAPAPRVGMSDVSDVHQLPDDRAPTDSADARASVERPTDHAPRT